MRRGQFMPGQQTLLGISYQEASPTSSKALAGYQLASGGVAGEIVFRDGGSGGTVLLRVNITVNTAVISTLLPGNGIRFTTDIYVTLPASAAVTIFCG